MRRQTGESAPPRPMRDRPDRSSNSPSGQVLRNVSPGMRSDNLRASDEARREQIGKRPANGSPSNTYYHIIIHSLPRASPDSDQILQAPTGHPHARREPGCNRGTDIMPMSRRSECTLREVDGALLLLLGRPAGGPLFLALPRLGLFGFCIFFSLLFGILAQLPSPRGILAVLDEELAKVPARAARERETRSASGRGRVGTRGTGEEREESWHAR